MYNFATTCRIDKDGNKEWSLNGRLHREDGPAIETEGGHKEWWRNGKRHREDGPAVEDAEGNKEWWFNDERHREHGPAIEYADGARIWYVKGFFVKFMDVSQTQINWREQGF